MDFFENTKLHSNSIKLFNSKLNEWISFMPKQFQNIGCVIMFPTLAMKILDKYIKTNTNTNKHIYLMSILSIFRHKSDYFSEFPEEQITTLNETWKNIFMENEAPIIKRRYENTPTDKQLAKGGHQLTFSQIVTKRDELPDSSSEKLLLCMYTMIPPVRADYFATHIVYNDDVPTSKNYIRIRDDNVECILTDFKTAKTYKQITHTFPPCLVTVLKDSLKFKPRDYLFINTKGEPHTRNSFVLWTRRCLTRIFETDFTLVFFRHAFITDFITNRITPDTTDAEIKLISDKMGHSPDMFRAYKWIRNGGHVTDAMLAISSHTED
jgi:hypothetical protein